MSKTNSPETGRRSRVPLLLAFAAACVAALLALLVLLPAPPERTESPGGKITVTKQMSGADGESGTAPRGESEAAPQIRESVGEEERTSPPKEQARAPAETAPSPPGASSGEQAPAPAAVPRSTGRMELIAPETESPQQSREPAGSSASASGRSASPDSAGEGADASAQESAPDTGSDQAAAESPESPSPDAPGAEWRMDLDAGEEEPETAQPGAAREAVGSPESASEETDGPPSGTEVGGWVQSRAKEFLGGVDEEGNILYRFDVWVSAPSALQSRIKSVAYAYDAPSATPESQESSEPRTQFKVSFGALSCAREVAVTITLEDGSTREAVVNGCEILN